MSAYLVSDLINFPPSVIKSNPIEEETIAYRAGRLENFPDRYAIVLFMDWNQNLINDKPYKLIKMKDSSKIGYGKLSFRAPSKPGLYEIVDNLIPGPNIEHSKDTFFPLENSY
ncbi:hypothetical protein ABEY41_11665 [Peribacillus butanolivorans]|uniref:hypothetical protein n=1 Tax=Peribacillus butanolivorans TaxID=421767 RepID=UPI003D2D4C77